MVVWVCYVVEVVNYVGVVIVVFLYEWIVCV